MSKLAKSRKKSYGVLYFIQKNYSQEKIIDNEIL